MGGVIIRGFRLGGRVPGGPWAGVVYAIGGRARRRGLCLCLGRYVGRGVGGIDLQVAVRGCQRLKWGKHPGGHGGADEAPQDQHHHQQKGEAATHP